MLHLAKSKPQFPRTKRVPTTSARNKSVTSNLICASAHSRTLTNSRLRNRNTHITNNSAIRVALTMQCCNRPRSQDLNSPERNARSATHRSCSNATWYFYFGSSTRISGNVEETQKASTHVRVLSEYSDIRNRTILDCLERNTRFEVVKCQSTLTSFLNLHAPVGQAFQPDKCACPLAKPLCSATAFVRPDSLTYVRQIGSKIPQIARSLSESSQMNKTRTIACTRNVKNGGVLLAHEGRQPGAIQSILIG